MTFYSIYIISKMHIIQNLWAGIVQLVQWLATGWTVRGLNPGGGKIFQTHPDQPWGPPSLSYTVGTMSFPGVGQQMGCVTDHPYPSSVKVKERIKLYIYSPSGPSWLVLG
jgi:hypothetical protein